MLAWPNMQVCKNKFDRVDMDILFVTTRQNRQLHLFYVRQKGMFQNQDSMCSIIILIKTIKNNIYLLHVYINVCVNIFL